MTGRQSAPLNGYGKLRVAVNHLRTRRGFLPLGDVEQPGQLEVYNAFQLINSADGPATAAWLRENAPDVAAVLCGAAHSPASVIVETEP